MIIVRIVVVSNQSIRCDLAMNVWKKWPQTNRAILKDFRIYFRMLIIGDSFQKCTISGGEFVGVAVKCNLVIDRESETTENFQPA